MSKAKFRFTVITVTLVTLLFTAQARATFLGLGLGNYDLTLLNSSSLCGGSNCTGTISITGDPATVANFSWNFTINSDAFNWTHFTAVAGGGTSSCAIESFSSQLTLTSTATNCATAAGSNLNQHLFFLENSSTNANTWLYSTGQFCA